MDNFYPAARLADSLAEYLLAGKVDKHGQPLIDHARRVARKCTNLSDEQYIAALLHDCAEDGKSLNTLSIWSDPTDIRFSVCVLFGDSVSSIILSLTRRPLEETYRQYIERVADDDYAIPIKLADLEENLDELRGPIDDSLRERYKKAHDYLRSALEGRDEDE